MLSLHAVECSSVLPAPCWPAGRHSLLLFGANHRFHLRRRNHVRRLYIFSPGRQSSDPIDQIFVGTRAVSPCSAYEEGRLVAGNANHGGVMQRRKEREARIRKQLQRVTISPSAYDTAWVSMVPLSGSTNAPRFPQCIQWILRNQKANGSWGIEKISKDVLLSTLACVIALKKWNLGEEQMRRGLHFIGKNFSIVMDKRIADPTGFSLIFPGMLNLGVGMGLEFPSIRRLDINAILHLWEEELERLSTAKSVGAKAYLAYVSEGLGNLVDWNEVMKFQRKNGSLFNCPSTTAALLLHKYDDKALQFLTSVVNKSGSAVPAVYPLDIRHQLSMVDSLEKIGISQHFSSDIKSILDMAYSLWVQKNEEIMLDFATCSLAFRLLRMNGYGVSPDALSHVEEVTSFHNSFQGHLNDSKSLLELYKASKVSICENELILDNIGYWSGNLLTTLPLEGMQKLPISKEIEHALKFPFYTTLERLDHKRNIENFDVRDYQMLKTQYMPCGVNEDILSLAVEDFTLSQSIYRDELVHLDSWVKEKRLDQLQFARQKATYCYLFAAGSIIHHELFDARISIAQISVLVTIIDDFFDGEGSKQELEDLITLVEKWDENYNGKLYSESVKILFTAIYTSVKELGSMVSAVQNYDVKEHLIEAWIDVLRSMMLEAEWRINGYVPTIEEYMKKAAVSVSSFLVMLPALYLLGQKLSRWILKDQEFGELVRLMATSARLLNDIQSVERECREGKLNIVSLLVHHSGGSISIEMAKLEVTKSISTTRRDLLRLVLREESVIPRPCKDVFWKICKAAHFFYFETDGYSSPDKMVSAVNALIHEPLKLPSWQSMI